MPRNDYQDTKHYVCTRRVVHTHQKRDGTIVHLDPNRIYLKEVLPDLKNWKLLLQENVLSIGGNHDHVPVSLAHML